jgi:hypothetical protein
MLTLRCWDEDPVRHDLRSKERWKHLSLDWTCESESGNGNKSGAGWLGPPMACKKGDRLDSKLGSGCPIGPLVIGLVFETTGGVVIPQSWLMFINPPRNCPWSFEFKYGRRGTSDVPTVGKQIPAGVGAVCNPGVSVVSSFPSEERLRVTVLWGELSDFVLTEQVHLGTAWLCPEFCELLSKLLCKS